jgi:hypothetical protein
LKAQAGDDKKNRRRNPLQLYSFFEDIRASEADKKHKPELADHESGGGGGPAGGEHPRPVQAQPADEENQGKDKKGIKRDIGQKRIRRPKVDGIQGYQCGSEERYRGASPYFPEKPISRKNSEEPQRERGHPERRKRKAKRQAEKSAPINLENNVHLPVIGLMEPTGVNELPDRFSINEVVMEGKISERIDKDRGDNPKTREDANRDHVGSAILAAGKRKYIFNPHRLAWFAYLMSWNPSASTRENGLQYRPLAEVVDSRARSKKCFYFRILRVEADYRILASFLSAILGQRCRR